MLLGWHYNYYYRNAYAMNQYLANHGYIVLSVNYRSGIGYGMEFREALNYGATGGSEFNDIMGAGVYMRSRTDVDPQRRTVGWLLRRLFHGAGLARASDMYRCRGRHAWRARLEIVIRNFVLAYDPQARPDAAGSHSNVPLVSVKTWRSPVLLIHGDVIATCPSETVHLVEALRKQRVEFEQLIFPDEIHDFLTMRIGREHTRPRADFLDRHLGVAGRE